MRAAVRGLDALAASDSAPLFLCFISLAVRCVVGGGGWLRLSPRLPHPVYPRSLLACTMLLESLGRLGCITAYPFTRASEFSLRFLRARELERRPPVSLFFSWE